MNRLLVLLVLITLWLALDVTFFHLPVWTSVVAGLVIALITGPITNLIFGDDS